MEMLQALEESWPADIVATYGKAFPTLEIVHLTGLTLVFAGMVAIDLRLLGFRREVPVTLLERYLLPFVWVGFGIAAFSGGWLFIYEARTLVADGPFLIKMALIATAGLNALVMHKLTRADIASWDVGVMPPAAVRASAALSMAIWFTVLACGRLIAYYYPVIF
jgi:hypothetical protein